jgi:hypothetical protein
MSGDRLQTLLAVLLLAGGTACGEKDATKAGAPVLQSFAIVDNTGSPVMVGGDGGMPMISPRVHFVLRFDRLLDGARLEDVSGSAPVGKPGVVSLVGPGMPQAHASYVPNGDGTFALLFPSGPQIVVNPAPTLPSGATVTATIDKTKIFAKGGEGPFIAAPGVAETISFATLPFSADISVAGAPAEAPDPSAPDAGGPDAGAAQIASDAAINVVFSNIPQAEIKSHIRVVVTDAAGAPVLPESAAQASEEDPALFAIAPPEAGWPRGGAITVIVDAGAADALGVPIPSEARAYFSVEP